MTECLEIALDVNLTDFQLGQANLDQQVDAGKVKVDGSRATVTELLGLLDTYPFWFDIVTP